MTRIASLAMALTGSIVFGVGVFSASIAQAACSWNVSGRWAIQQSNGAGVNFSLSQSGSTVRGTAFTPGIGTGNVSGSVKGRSLGFKIYWPKYSIGAYTGMINNGGFITGQTHDTTLESRVFNTPQTAWHSTSPMKCL